MNYFYFNLSDVKAFTDNLDKIGTGEENTYESIIHYWRCFTSSGQWQSVQGV